MLVDKGDIQGLECINKSKLNPFPKYDFSLHVRFI